MKALILGGTSEASALARALADDPRIFATLSYAGRTRAPVAVPIPTRTGGFGGVEGLVSYLRTRGIDRLVDATHPFAGQISRHAAQAAAMTGIRLLAIVRPPWEAAPADRWTVVPDMAAAALVLGPTPRRVFLTVGQQELATFASAPWHDYLIRSVEPPATLPARARYIAARGPFAEDAERRLLRSERIELLVTKNSGGGATAAKLAAARALGVRVVMVSRPPAPLVASVPDMAGALAWLRHGA
jgi:precorrin-6A/cobalt-precorrin-6A reductase